MMTTYDPYTTTTGLFSDYVGTVQESWFAMSERGVLELHLKMLVKDSDEYPEWEERYGCGQDWQCVDGGNTAENARGVNKGFNKNSGYGKFLEALKGLKAVDDLKKQGRVDPRKADNWIGCKLKMGAQTGEFEDKLTGQKVEWSKNYPVAYLGIDPVHGGTVAAPNVASVPPVAPVLAPDPITAPTVASAPVPPAPGLIPDATRESMKVLAKDYPFQDWLDRVLELPGVVGDNALVVAIADEAGLYTALRTG